jgi:hypothetical protein
MSYDTMLIGGMYFMGSPTKNMRNNIPCISYVRLLKINKKTFTFEVRDLDTNDIIRDRLLIKKEDKVIYYEPENMDNWKKNKYNLCYTLKKYFKVDLEDMNNTKYKYTINGLEEV